MPAATPAIAFASEARRLIEFKQPRLPRGVLLGFGKLGSELIGRTLQVIPSQDRGFGISRIGEMCGIVDSGALLLDQDFPIEIGGHAIEIANHAFHKSDPLSPVVHLKLLSANERRTRPHRHVQGPGLARRWCRLSASISGPIDGLNWFKKRMTAH